MLWSKFPKENKKSRKSSPCLNDEENGWIVRLFEGAISLYDVLNTQDKTKLSKWKGLLDIYSRQRSTITTNGLNVTSIM